MNQTPYGYNVYYEQRLFGRLADAVRKGAQEKVIELRKAEAAEADAFAKKWKGKWFRKPSAAQIQAHQDSLSKKINLANRLETSYKDKGFRTTSKTSENTDRLWGYEQDKKNKNVIWDANRPDSIYNSTEDIRKKMGKAQKLRDSWFFKKRNRAKAEAMEQEAINQYYKWKNGVSDFDPSKFQIDNARNHDWSKVAKETFGRPEPRGTRQRSNYIPRYDTERDQAYRYAMGYYENNGPSQPKLSVRDHRGDL